MMKVKLCLKFGKNDEKNVQRRQYLRRSRNHKGKDTFKVFSVHNIQQLLSVRK